MTTSTLQNDIEAFDRCSANQDAFFSEDFKSFVDGRVAGWERSAEQGDADAQYLLAISYSRGLGRESNLSKAADLLRRAADQGHCRSGYQLAYMLDHGSGVPTDHAAATGYLQTAAENGFWPAIFQLSHRLRKGIGGEPNEQESERWLRIGAAKGHIAAMRELADLAFEKGNFGEAHAWLEQAGKSGDAEAFHRLATCILAEEPKNGHRDADGGALIVTDGRASRVRDYYRRAAELGHVESSLALARLFEGALGDRDPFQSFHWYKNAAEAGDLLAQRKVAELSLLGIGTAKSPEEAVRWFRRIVETGQVEGEHDFASRTAWSEALFKLGVLTFVGKGIGPDRSEGLRLMQKAAEQGDRTARRFLEERDRSWLWRCLFNRFHWPSLSYLDR